MARIRRTWRVIFWLLSTKCLLTFSFSQWPIKEKALAPSSSFLYSSSPVYDDAEFGDDSAEFVDNFEDKNSLMASPLSQLPTEEEEAMYRGTFARKENWLEEATEEILGLEKLPLGSLREDDVESITGLMAAWVRRRSIEAALKVEQLLKRIVDEMRAHNPDVHVTARMYTIVSADLTLFRFYAYYQSGRICSIFLQSFVTNCWWNRLSTHGRRVEHEVELKGLNISMMG